MKIVYDKNILVIELQGNKTSHATLRSCKIEQQEAWRILDAIIAYKDDYELSVPVIKTIKSI